jgi:predicted O-linked N-acetylglucosamine transferase (SPINDLY family)
VFCSWPALRDYELPELILTLREVLARAAAALERGQDGEARRLCTAVLRAQPNDLVALEILAVLQSRSGDLAVALATCESMLAIRPEHAKALHMRGAVLQELKRFNEAIASYDHALAIPQDYAETHHNRALVLHELRRYGEALAGYDRALAIRPAHAASWHNRGNTLHALERFEEALESYDKALAIQPDRASIFHDRGCALQELKRPAEALASFENALALDPAHTQALNGVADCALKLCDWTRREKLGCALRLAVEKGTSTVYPLVLLGYADDPALQIAAARHFIGSRIPVAPHALWRGEVWRNDRIKIAYVSADFRSHPVSHLIAELFELHDRSRFEIVGVSLGPDDRSDMRARVVKAFDRFYDVQSTPDAEVARIINGLRTDIVVDLTGYTMGCRPEILASRPAPIAVNYLGYPGTMGADFVDYIIADPIVLPFDRQPYCAERIVHLPDTYQANDRKRAIAVRAPSRQAHGLPAQGVVFCCFNSSWKIAPTLFDLWMRLLRRVDGSVLWLLHEFDDTKSNLRRAAAERGVDPARLVFAARAVPADHLARHVLADLFLDTLPYNAHTTASDALWAGLPLITCRGDSFAGRVAASLLHAVGLGDLVTSSLEEYEALALNLARDEPLRASLKCRIAKNRLHYPLFDSPRFCRRIEAAYVAMWERWQQGEPPASFAVDPEEAGCPMARRH